MIRWEIKGREFGNCNCDYGCPCQFNALPTHGHCGGLAVFDIEQGFRGTTRLDGLRCAGIFRWPGPIHEGKGEGLHIIDRRATPEQREALLRILRGEDTEPGATVYQVFASTCDTFHDPIVADIDFELDIDGRRAGAKIEGLVEMHGEPILNPSPRGAPRAHCAAERLRVCRGGDRPRLGQDHGADQLHAGRYLWAVCAHSLLSERHGALSSCPRQP